jgi:hypothetical protein
MRLSNYRVFIIVFVMGLITVGWSKKPETKTYFNTFESEKVGALPLGWCVNANFPRGVLADWEVVVDSFAASPIHELAITKINDVSGRQFNICWNKALRFQNGELEVKVRANYGETDQGGGLAWRIKDPSNYYFVRYNPLEHIFRLYYVKDGTRHELATAYDIPISTREWFTVKVEHKTDSIFCFLNNKKLISTISKAISETGGVGIWSKADAATSFDDFKMTCFGE